jgi:hypothetical protein
MSDNHVNFVKWFKEPLSCLYQNTDAGFIILMGSLPLLERYLRQKIGIFEGKLDPTFYKAFTDIFPSVGNPETARKFWDIYRNGLLHQATLKTKEGVIRASVHNAAQEIEAGYDSQGVVFTVSPVRVSQKIIATIESDFSTFEGLGSPRHSPAQISPTGHSGYS